MGKIKSALELAMEKTANMAVDREKIKQKELKRQGQTLASAILNKTEKNGQEKLTSFKEDELPFVKEGFVETLLTNIHLPLYINSENNLDNIRTAFTLISAREELFEPIFDQLSQLFERYIEDIQNLKEALKQQYMPMLMQKQQQIMQQTGQNIQLEAEQDPEFMELLGKNRKALEQEYGKVIAQAKTELLKAV